MDIDNSLPEKVEPKEQTEKKKKRRKNDSSPSGYTPTSLMTCWNGFKVWLQSQNYWTENVIIDVTGKKNFLCLNFFRRVKVVVLSSIKPKAASFHSAMEFRRNRLFGEDVHRSLVMLPKKVRWQVWRKVKAVFILCCYSATWIFMPRCRMACFWLLHDFKYEAWHLLLNGRQ